jgi:hypothetical protein
MSIIGAHVFNVENVGGTVRFVDAQTGQLDVSRYFDIGVAPSYTRIDDLPVPADVSSFGVPRGE